MACNGRANEHGIVADHACDVLALFIQCFILIRVTVIEMTDSLKQVGTNKN